MLILDYALRLLIAGILLQTLFFKFTGAEESVWIFTTLGIDPIGRYGSGVVELLASILLFVPGYTLTGAVLSLSTITGAIASHLLILGIEIQGDGGLLFYLALAVFVASLVLIYLHRLQFKSGFPFIPIPFL